jgi:hypothetical protein
LFVGLIANMVVKTGDKQNMKLHEKLSLN